MHGWVPISIQALAVVVLVLAIGWRSRRWRLMWVPLAALVGVGVAEWAHWFINSDGLADDPAPHQLWIWIALTGLAAGVLVLAGAVPSGGVAACRCWRCRCACCARRWRSTCGWATSRRADRLEPVTAGPLPDQTDRATVTAVAAQKATTSCRPRAVLCR